MSNARFQFLEDARAVGAHLQEQGVQDRGPVSRGELGKLEPEKTPEVKNENDNANPKEEAKGPEQAQKSGFVQQIKDEQSQRQSEGAGPKKEQPSQARPDNAQSQDRGRDGHER